MALRKTIAEEGALNLGTLHAMACHESEIGNEDYCIGWLAHQLGRGNNIGLRIAMISCENRKEIETFGEQHQRFEDTLPDF